MDAMEKDIRYPTLWEMRTRNGKIKEIGSYFPEIGRGNIEHDIISHAEVEKGFDKFSRRTFFQWIAHLFDL